MFNKNNIIATRYIINFGLIYLKLCNLYHKFNLNPKLSSFFLNYVNKKKNLLIIIFKNSLFIIKNLSVIFFSIFILKESIIQNLFTNLKIIKKIGYFLNSDLENSKSLSIVILFASNRP